MGCNTKGPKWPLLSSGESMRHLLYKETDHFTRVTECAYYDDVEDKLEFERTQDAGLILETNKIQMNAHGSHPNYSDSNGMHLAARIPMILVEQWKTQQGFDWFKSTDNERRAWLDKPEHAFLKVRPGKLGGTNKAPLRTKVN